VAIYRLTVSCIDQLDGLCLHLYTVAYLEFKRWWSVHVPFKWNYV